MTISHEEADLWRNKLNVDRLADELLGICNGILADGVLTDNEIQFLKNWLDRSIGAMNDWPGNIIRSRIREIIEDGVITEEERQSLIEILTKTAGSNVLLLNAQGATRLPIDDPPPVIVFPEKAFCFTGTFFFGTRKACERAVMDRGGRCHSSVRLDTDFLVIGLAATRAWAHSSFGRKIERAVELQKEHQRLRIVSEEYWSIHCSERGFTGSTER